MSEVTADESIEEDISVPDEEPVRSRPQLSRKTIMLVAGAGLALLSLIGAGIYFSGLLDPPSEPVEHEKPSLAVVFYDLPEMVVNLESSSNMRTYLKIQISLELDESQDLGVLERLLPRVVDHFQVYLRELRADDLHGSAGIYRLKEELLRRVRSAAQPVKIRDVLFKEMLVQ